MTSSLISPPAKGSEDFGEQVLTKAVKAGRRTYFFDVRATRGGDYFLTITESRKKTNPDGTFGFDRHNRSAAKRRPGSRFSDRPRRKREVV